MNNTMQTTIQQLSNREKQILFYISEGMSSKEIADKLFLSKNTVDTHRRNMIRKRSARSCTELVLAMI